MKTERSGALRVLSWNVHGCIDTRGRYRPEEVASMLQRLDADILALQEIDTRRRPAGEINARELFERTVADHSVFAATLADASGQYGHMLMSRFPIEEAHIHDLPRVDKEPRKLIHGRVRTDQGPVDAFATHLGFRRREQASQARAVAGLISNAGHPVILLGDLNERFRRGAVFRALNPQFQSAPRRATFPSRWPVLPLDQIWFQSLRLVHSRVCRESGDLSDHLPVMAELSRLFQARPVKSPA